MPHTRTYRKPNPKPHLPLATLLNAPASTARGVAGTHRARSTEVASVRTWLALLLARQTSLAAVSPGRTGSRASNHPGLKVNRVHSARNGPITTQRTLTTAVGQPVAIVVDKGERRLCAVPTGRALDAVADGTAARG